MKIISRSNDGKWATGVVAPGDILPQFAYHYAWNSREAAVSEAIRWGQSGFGGLEETYRKEGAAKGLSLREWAITRFRDSGKIKARYWTSFILPCPEPESNELGEVAP